MVTSTPLILIVLPATDGSVPKRECQYFELITATGLKLIAALKHHPLPLPLSLAIAATGVAQTPSKKAPAKGATAPAVLAASPPAPAGVPAPSVAATAYVVTDFTISRSFGRMFQAFFGVQNLFDRVYFVQTNPSTIGTPRMVNGGTASV